MKKGKKSKKDSKSKNSNLLMLVVSIIIIIIVILLIIFRKKEEVIVVNNDIKEKLIDLGIVDYVEFEDENYIFKDYEDFNNYFNSDKLTEEDFVNNNYVLIKVMYDSCSEEDIIPYNYNFVGKNIDITFKYTAKCGVCAPLNMYYLFKLDKNVEEVNVNVNYEAVNNPHCDPNVTYTPLIYIYPTQEMNVKVILGYKDLLTVTYPKYNNGWNVLAKPNGDLIDSNGRKYYGLYWEGLNYISEEFSDGFVVKGSEVLSFLEEKLSLLGLNEREANEFIIYWLPILEVNNYNLIRFENIDKINEQMPLEVIPKPDTIIRVLMEYKPIDNIIDIKPQELTKVQRRGFSVVEWGGSLIK